MIKLRAPGRICLFGEHQDYLNYPIIAMAISKYIYLEAERITENKIVIDLPNVNDSVEIPLIDKQVEYTSKRDYLRSGYNQFIRRGISFSKGYKIKIIGDIPINAGVASSSALVIVWLQFLNLISGKPMEKYELAIEGYNTEVREFRESGGMMDHFTAAFGDIIYLEPKIPEPKVMNIKVKLNGFVLGNSMEKKDTVEDLIRVKKITLNAFEALKEVMPDFDRYSTAFDHIKPYLPSLKEEYQKKIIGNFQNKYITLAAKMLIKGNKSFIEDQNAKASELFYKQLGDALNMHHEQLRDNIGISTPKIERIISNCLNAGALGCKINGSGFGGTMFALSPGNESSVKDAIEDAGGKAFIINTSNGVEAY